MAERGAGDADYDDSTAGKAGPASPLEQLGQPRGTFGSRLTTAGQKRRELGIRLETQVPASATVARRSTEWGDARSVDEELRALGLWEEGMTEGQKMDLLMVLAESKKTAQSEEASRERNFARSTVSMAAVRDAWEEEEPPGGLERYGKEDEWRALGDIPYERMLPAAKSRKSTQPARRVCSMEQRLNFQWGDEDSSDDLYDTRFPQKKDRSQSSVAKTEELRESEHLPPVDALRSCSPAQMILQGAAPAEMKEKRLLRPAELLNSWETLHEALREAQSVPGLPVRPWGQPMSPSSFGNQDSRTQGPENPLEQDTPWYYSRSTGAMKESEDHVW